MTLTKTTLSQLKFLARLHNLPENEVLQICIDARARHDRDQLRKTLTAVDAAEYSIEFLGWTEEHLAGVRALAETVFPDEMQ